MQESDDFLNMGDYQLILLNNFIAPYSGKFYIFPELNSLDDNGVLMVNEDIDTKSSKPSVNVNPNVNHIPTGEIKISGLAKSGQTLSIVSTLEDQDGLGDFEYQWFSNSYSDSKKADETYKKFSDPILGETNSTYQVSEKNVGKTITVRVGYIDGEGYLETISSNPTAVILTKISTKQTNGDDLLTGSTKNDKISGLTGNDTLVGGLGADTLTGGLGADVFKFNASNETGTTSKIRDVITDFKHSEGDKIDLSGVDAKSTILGDQAFTFIGSKPFNGTAGQLRLDSASGILYGNINEDYKPDFAIAMTGVKSLVVGDFVL